MPALLRDREVMSIFERELRHATWPSVWARDRLSFEPDDNQTSFLDCTEPDELLLWCRQSGKTECCGIKISHFALYHPGTLQLIVSASQRQSTIVQKRVMGCMQRLNLPVRTQVLREIDLPEDYLDPDSRIVRCSVLQMTLANGSEVISVPASPDTVRGYSPDAIYVDEAARVADDVHQAISPMRASKPVSLTMASTAAWKMGRYYEVWTGDDPAWWKSEVTAAQCPRIPEAFLEREKRTMPERYFRQEYFCEFQELVNSVFPSWMIDSIFTSEVKPLFTRKGGLDSSVHPLGILKDIK